MARRRRKYKTRNDQIFTLMVLISLFISGGIGGAISSAATGGKFDLGIFVITFLIVLVVLMTIVTILSLPSVKGKIGERRVAKRLNKLANKYDGKVINDVIIPGDNNKTSQIDHILIAPQGIYVVETKNYAGRVYGNDNDEQWTQVLAYGHTKNKLYSPVKQNMTHIYRLKALIDRKVRLESVVVFVNGNTAYINSEYVYSLRDLKHLIQDEDEKILLHNDVEDIYKRVMEYKNNPIATTKEHVKSIKAAKNGLDNNICPRCGGKLVLRTSKKDGSQFYGCENFPKCKFIKKN